MHITFTAFPRETPEVLSMSLIKCNCASLFVIAIIINTIIAINAMAADPTCPFLIPSDLPFSQVRVLLSELNLVRWEDEIKIG